MVSASAWAWPDILMPGRWEHAAAQTLCHRLAPAVGGVLPDGVPAPRRPSAEAIEPVRRAAGDAGLPYDAYVLWGLEVVLSCCQ